MTIKRALMIIVSLAILSPPASVGEPETYQVTTCNAAPNGQNNSWTWSTDDTAHYEDHAQCPYPVGGNGGTMDKESGLSSTDHLGATLGAQPESHAGWTFTAPPNTTISAITYERYLGHENDTSNTWSPALRADGTIIDNQTCTVIFPSVACALGGPPGQGEPPTTITGLTAKELVFGETCQAPQGQECVTGNILHSVWAAMYGATVILNDPTPPTLSTPTGALWEPGKANGYHQGTENVTTSAEDIGGGVKSITLASDGDLIGAYDAHCNYTKPQPCPASTGQQTLTLPTTTIPDGTHTLTLYATDAAGNESTIASNRVTIDNTPPLPPTALTATPTQPGGPTFTLTWTNPPSQVAPIASATYLVCATTPPDTCTQPTSAPPAGPATITVTGPGTWTVKLWLMDAAGNSDPSSAAETTLAVPPGSTKSGGSGITNSGDGTGEGAQGGAHGPGGGPTADAGPAVHLSARLHGRDLVVHVTGPSTGRVHVSFTGRLHGRQVASGARTVFLKHGRLTTIFKLGFRTAAHATITVSARLDHLRPVMRVVRR